MISIPAKIITHGISWSATRSSYQRDLSLSEGSIRADRALENNAYRKIDNCICGLTYAVIPIEYK